MPYISRHSIEMLKDLQSVIVEPKYNYFVLALDKVIDNLETKRIEQNNRARKYYEERKK